MPTIIKGQPTSQEIIQKLKDLNEPVMLSFSCGKDSIAAWIALEDAGIEVVPVYMWYVPHLKFVDEEIAYFEDFFGKKIHQYPHASFYGWLNTFTMQSPERLGIIEAAKLPSPKYEDIWKLIKEELGMPGAWVADGVRASDSIVRRASLSKHGIMKPNNKKVSPIADWLKGEVIEAIENKGIDLPIDYEIWGRSFDGIDKRFTKPMKERLPEDYALLCEWFPMIELDILRGETYGL